MDRQKIGHLVSVGPGELLGSRYRMVERLGSGGMSEVWRGHDEVLDRPVAIKMGRQASDRVIRRRIRLEAKAAARLSHPHITNVYDYDEVPGPDGEPIPFVVMELVDGVPMAIQLAGDGALPWPVAVRACAQVAGALAAAHAQGVVHRDIKPGNVVLTATGAKVLDFGISALVGDPEMDEDGVLLGTPAYLAPERLDGGAVTAASDVYALGLLLHRSLTGRLPWPADTPTQMLKAHLHVDPEPMPPVDGLPPAVAALCQACLAKDPADRPTAEQVARELAAVLDAAPDLASVALTSTAGIRPSAGDPASGAGRRAAGGQTVAATAVHRTVTWPPARQRAAGWLSRRVTAAGLLASAGLIGAAAAWPAGDHGPSGTPAQAAAGSDAKHISCAVEYEVSRDTGSAMTASITVTNTGAEPFPNWQLSFDLPGDQQLSQGSNASWRQDGRSVTARSGGTALSPGATARLAFSARYHAGNPLPVTYRVNGTGCRAVVLGPTAKASGTPASQPAQARKPGANHGGDQPAGNGHKKKHGKGRGRH